MSENVTNNFNGQSDSSVETGSAEERNILYRSWDSIAKLYNDYASERVDDYIVTPGKKVLNWVDEKEPVTEFVEDKMNGLQESYENTKYALSHPTEMAIRKAFEMVLGKETVYNILNFFKGFFLDNDIEVFGNGKNIDFLDKWYVDLGEKHDPEQMAKLKSEMTSAPG